MNRSTHESNPTVVNVVQMLMRIIWIIDNERSTQAITVLVLVVAVIPECPLKWELCECADITCEVSKGRYRLVSGAKVV
jgi:hypothetical protein